MLLSLALLHAVNPAYAWKHTGFAWSSEDDNGDTPGLLTRNWYMDDDVEDSLPEGYQLEAVQAGFDNWEEYAQCAAIGNHFQGTDALSDPAPGSETSVYFDDPSDLLGTGVLGLTGTYGDGTTVIWNDQRYSHILSTWIVFQDNTDWGTTDDINAGTCSNEYSIEGVATHEIGHSWGLDHSCEENEACESDLLKEATMFWTSSPCDAHQVVPNDDDIESITNIYGPSIELSASQADRTGAVPFEVCFQAAVPDDVEIDSQKWDFGDGGSCDSAVDGDACLNPCHTYETVGQFSVTANVVISSDVCSQQTVKSTQLGYVVACNEPAPEAGADGFFELSPSDGLTWQTINHTDVSTYGCVDTIEWEVYSGTGEGDIKPENKIDFNGDADGGDSIGAWAPKITFPAAGDYVVVMNVGGPAGLKAGFMAVTVSDSTGGCSSVPATTSAGGALFGLAAGAALIRRRRR